MRCWHKFMNGFGGMGDGYKCVKCGCEETEVLEIFFVFCFIFCRILKNDGTYGSFNEYPYIRKFSKKVTLYSDHDNWIQFFNRKGKLVNK